MNKIPILWPVVMVIALIGVIYYLAVGRRKQFAPVIAPAGDDEPLVTGRGASRRPEPVDAAGPTSPAPGRAGPRRPCWTWRRR